MATIPAAQAARQNQPQASRNRTLPPTVRGRTCTEVCYPVPGGQACYCAESRSRRSGAVTRLSGPPRAALPPVRPQDLRGLNKRERAELRCKRNSEQRRAACRRECHTNVNSPKCTAACVERKYNACVTNLSNL